MAKQKVVKRWITVNGNRVPIYEDGTMGGIGAKLQQGKSEGGRKTYRVYYEDGNQKLLEADSKEELDAYLKEHEKETGKVSRTETADEYDKKDTLQKEDFVVDYPIKDDPDYDKKRKEREITDEEDFDERLDSIADRYNTSKPVSGDWETEVEHEQEAIAKEFGISKEEAKQVMKDRLGFTDEQFEKDQTQYDLGGNPIYTDEDVQRLKADDARRAEIRKAKEEGFADVESMKSYYEEVGDEDDDDFPFQSKEPSREEIAENWNKGTTKTTPDIKQMGYAEAGAYMAEHKEEFGLSDDDDAYQIAAQVKNGDIKLDKDGKVPKQDREDVKSWNEKMSRENSIDDYEGPDKGTPKTEMGAQFQSKVDTYTDKFLKKRSDKELEDLKSNLERGAQFTGTTEEDQVALTAIRQEQERRAAGAGSIDLSEYKYIANTNGYQTYRKIVDGKGVWVAQDQDGKNPPFPITYNQALGYEPIGNSSVEKLQHELGEKLLGRKGPKDKSIKIGDKEVGVSKDKGIHETRMDRTVQAIKNGQNNLKSAPLGDLKELALRAGKKSSEISGMSKEELRRMLLSMWRK